MDKSIEYKIELWKEISEMMTQVENRNSGMMNITAVIGVGVTMFSFIYEAKINQGNQIVEMVYYIMPLIVMLCLLTFGFDNRHAAILKGYLAGIEDSINYDLGECVYQFNSLYSSLYAPKYFMTNNFISVVYGSAVIFLSIVCFSNIFLSNKLPLVIELIYLTVYLLNLAITMRDLLTNARIRKIARVYFHKSFYSYRIKNIGGDIKDILNFEIDINDLLKEFDANINNE